jgi:hypothetical protein
MMPTTTSDQHDLLTISPTIPTTPLHTPRRRVTGLRRILHTLLSACTRRHRQEQPRINPDYPRQETAVDRVIRLDPLLYLRSLSG